MFTFAENFKQCCNESCTYLAFEESRHNPEFLEAAKKCDDLYSKIEEKLSDEHELINNFDAAKNHEMGMDYEYIYHQGFKDCVYILRWIGIL